MSHTKRKSDGADGASAPATSTTNDALKKTKQPEHNGVPKPVFVHHWFRLPAISDFQKNELLLAFPFIRDIQSETCFNIQVESDTLTDEETKILIYLLRETFDPDSFSNASFLIQRLASSAPTTHSVDGRMAYALVEFGPRLNFSTAWSSNAVAICEACGLSKITRMERSRRLLLLPKDPAGFTPAELHEFTTSRSSHDPMTETRYPNQLGSFDSGIHPAPWFVVPVLKEGRAALERINAELGLGFDDQDLDYYTKLFVEQIKRDPTSVECFDVAQSNSEHSRHWFFTGKLVIDGKEMPESLMKLVKKPWQVHPANSVIAFSDNSSSQRGQKITTLLPKAPGAASPMTETTVDYDITFTAETHNFPSGVAPFPGAETGTGGRIRDGHATGTGSLVLAGTTGYCVGNLRIPGYELPWEQKDFVYPPNLASPLQIEVQASNGASDYGNKFGEPCIQGYTRSFGMRLPNGERREWLKPIMFTGGVGQMDARHAKKAPPKVGMCVVKLGGPAYRIGMGGGAASSMVQGDNAAHLDFNAVQRGDAEMEQKVNRVIRACVELGSRNPIVSIHDQGAGGNGNVLKEIVDPLGARIEIRDVLIGDKTLSVMELWGAEFQENDALLLNAEHLELFRNICTRENAPFSVVGVVTGDGRIVVHDSHDDTCPVDLELTHVLGKLPPKTFVIQSTPSALPPLALPADITVGDALNRVLRLLSVGSKRFLTSKVDRSVTGLIAQQQCVGPLHTPLADVAVIAQSHFGVSGAATSIGEQPIKGFINSGAMARLSVAESLTNLVFARITSLDSVKCSGNWMWAAKMAGEGAKMYEAALAVCNIMTELGIAIDGGKDSLSMAARSVHESTGQTETVKCPGALVISSYATVPDITLTVTPDVKLPGSGILIWVSITEFSRLGGSALAQVYNQVGDQCPDVENVPALKTLFMTTQNLLTTRKISAGHDVSDGGVLVTALEMAFAGNTGMDLTFAARGIDATNNTEVIKLLFSEEVGLVLEVAPAHQEEVLNAYKHAGLFVYPIGRTRSDPAVSVSVGAREVLRGDMRDLRDIWEETSFHLETLQCNPACVAQEKATLRGRTGPPFRVSFDMAPLAVPRPVGLNRPRVAVIRQEGSNGDREMASAFYLAGFEPWDVHMSDLQNAVIDLNNFRGVAFVGGFSYADVMDSAKGWSATIRFHPTISAQFNQFYGRADTFSLGVCNGCQLMALLGWIPFYGTPLELQPRFIHNVSGRYESRFSAVKIESSPSIMLRGMEGSTLGVWVAHGEGRAYFPNEDIRKRVLGGMLAPIRYVDDNNEHTEIYPFNPNGSPLGIAALCSPDGRHLAMMPHPERTVLKWQWPHLPADWRGDAMPASPWLRMFINAFEWVGRVEGAT